MRKKGYVIFRHNTNFTLDSVTMTGEGDASVLVATNPQNSSIELRGNGPVLKSVKTACPSATTRLLAPWNTAVEVEGATNFLVENVTVARSPNGAVIAWGGAGPGKIIGNRISDTLADAIHMTNGAHDIIVANNYIRRAETTSSPLSAISVMINHTLTLTWSAPCTPAVTSMTGHSIPTVSEYQTASPSSRAPPLAGWRSRAAR